MTDLHTYALQTRDELAPEIAALTDEEMDVATCCGPWTVRHLVAHMTALGNQTMPNFMRAMVRARFDFDRAIEGDLQRFVSDTATMQRAFAATLERTKRAPGPKYVMLGEFTLHGEDIRRALGRRGAHAPERLEALASAYVKTGAPIDGKRRAKGLTFEASDGDWSVGSGPVVRGPGIDLVRAISGRTDGYATLSGAGLAELVEREPLAVLPDQTSGVSTKLTSPTDT